MKPKVDFCFKELMEDEEVRNAFLAAVLGINVEDVIESRILPSHLRQKDKDEKLGILDVRVLLNNREQIDIEIQVTFSEYWAERTLFYLGKMFTDQLKPGENYQKLEKCIHIGILNFTMFDDEEYYSCFHFWSDEGRKLYSDKVEIHTLELPKLAKHDYPETELLKWLQFINAETKEEFEMAAEKNEYIKKAYEDLNRISADEEKRLEYEERERMIRDHQYFSTIYKETGLKEGLKEGLRNLDKHVRNLRSFGQTIIVAFNKFASDTDEEMELLREHCEQLGVGFAINNAFSEGGEGAVDMARLVVDTIENNPSESLRYTYKEEDSIQQKIEKVATNIYGASVITYSSIARNRIKLIEKMGITHYPVCIAKTQYSFSADPKIYGAVNNFEFHIKDIVINNGAEMIVAIAGEILRMPGLPKEPQALHIDIVDGEIEGLS